MAKVKLTLTHIQLVAPSTASMRQGLNLIPLPECLGHEPHRRDRGQPCAPHATSSWWRCWRRPTRSNRPPSPLQRKVIDELAKAEGLDTANYKRLLKLGFIAPNIVEAVLDGERDAAA